MTSKIENTKIPTTTNLLGIISVIILFIQCIVIIINYQTYSVSQSSMYHVSDRLYLMSIFGLSFSSILFISILFKRTMIGIYNICFLYIMALLIVNLIDNPNILNIALVSYPIVGVIMSILLFIISSFIIPGLLKRTEGQKGILLFGAKNTFIFPIREIYTSITLPPNENLNDIRFKNTSWYPFSAAGSVNPYIYLFILFCIYTTVSIIYIYKSNQSDENSKVKDSSIVASGLLVELVLTSVLIYKIALNLPEKTYNI